MKGDVVVIEEEHRRAAASIAHAVIGEIEERGRRTTIAVAGESGSGKSETGAAIAKVLAEYDFDSVVLGQDDYFVLPPKSNDAKRRANDAWIGPHVEVRLDLLDDHLAAAQCGDDQIVKPLIDYDADSVEQQVLDLDGIHVVIAEGTYTTLLRHVDHRVFIARSRLDTLEHRQKRNRGNEVGDPFIEEILELEHKIIAGHRNLADFVITRDYDVIAR